MEKYGIVGQATEDNIIRRMRTARWIPKAKTHTLTDYAIFIAFLLQQWLHERASRLRYTYIALLDYFYFHQHTRFSQPPGFCA